MYMIENDVQRTRSTAKEFPFDDLEINQSFCVPPQKALSAQNTMKKYKDKDDGRVFVSEKEHDGSRRIWRVK